LREIYAKKKQRFPTILYSSVPNCAILFAISMREIMVRIIYCAKPIQPNIYCAKLIQPSIYCAKLDQPSIYFRPCLVCRRATEKCLVAEVVLADIIVMRDTCSIEHILMVSLIMSLIRDCILTAPSTMELFQSVETNCIGLSLENSAERICKHLT
jgi:hypothetical protein